MVDLIIKNGLSQATITSNGRIKSLILNSIVVIDSSNTSTDTLQQDKCYLMFPWQGRLSCDKIIKKISNDDNLIIPNRDSNDYPIHGLVLSTNKILKESKEASVTFILQHKFNFPSIEETYTISANELMIQTKLLNQSDEAQYFYYGYHPFICFNNLTINDMMINSNCNKLIQTSSEVLPYVNDKGEYIIEDHSFISKPILNDEYDNLFYNSTSEDTFIELYNKELNVSVGVRNISTINDNKQIPFNYIQIYTPTSRKEICFEPLTAPTNAFNIKFPTYTNSLQPKEIAMSQLAIYIKKY